MSYEYLERFEEVCSGPWAHGPFIEGLLVGLEIHQSNEDICLSGSIKYGRVRSRSAQIKR